MVRERFSIWFIWQIFIPLAILIGIWPIYRYIIEVKYPYHMAFSSGDLLIFASLLLIGVSVQFKESQVLRQQDSFDIYLMLDVAKAAAIIFIFIFGFVKYDVISNGYFSSQNPIPKKLTGFACFSLTVVFASVMFSIYMFWASLSREMRIQHRR